MDRININYNDKKGIFKIVNKTQNKTLATLEVKSVGGGFELVGIPKGKYVIPRKDNVEHTLTHNGSPDFYKERHKALYTAAFFAESFANKNGMVEHSQSC